MKNYEDSNTHTAIAFIGVLNFAAIFITLIAAIITLNGFWFQFAAVSILLHFLILVTDKFLGDETEN